MRLNRYSIIVKLMLFLSLFFVTVILFLTLSNATITKQNLKASEADKIKTVVNTILPIISLNLSFGFEEPVRDILKSLPENNNNILGTRLIGIDGTTKYASYLDPTYHTVFSEPDRQIFYNSSPILDPVTHEALGTLEIAYSNLYYQKMMEEYRKFLMLAIFPTLIAFTLFSLFFYRKLLPLKTLSQTLGSFQPGREIDTQIQVMKGRDEIAVINNSAAEMMAKIKEYTDMLNDLNANLEQKIKKELEKNREKDQILIRQSRQAALGEMIGNIAHQWRQPINALGLIIQDIEDAHFHNELSENYIQNSIDQSMELIGHMSETIDDFRNFFMPNKDKSYFPINEVLENALKIVGASLEHAEITVIQDIQSHLHLYTYKNELTQVIINILNNSKDAFGNYDGPNKTITIKALRDEQKGAIILTLTDNAGGIDEAIKEKIFDPYFTTKHKDQGTGIGLYMAKSIIESNIKGMLIAENVGDGARLCIILPFDTISMQIEQ